MVATALLASIPGCFKPSPLVGGDDTTDATGPATSTGAATGTATGAASTTATATAGTSDASGTTGFPQGVCGDGIKDPGEPCDDGNNSNNDGCLNNCQVAACGDGFVQVGVEECDDGNNSNNDGCLNNCRVAACGDGFVQVGVEECDDGNANDNDDCPSTCTPAFCGDGFVWEGVEACDDGQNLGQAPGDCAPDCSKVVDVKRIMLHPAPLSADLATLAANQSKTILQFLDGLCDQTLPGSKAMFVYQDQRVASVFPNTGDGQVDWVLDPWTLYVNAENQPLWKTSELALLGVENGMSVPLANSIDPNPNNYPVRTGMDNTWRNAPENCLDWTTNSGNEDQMLGNGSSKTGYLTGYDVGDCSEIARFYCVEQ